MPTLSATSEVIGYELALPRIPSVPKNLRAIPVIPPSLPPGAPSIGPCENSVVALCRQQGLPHQYLFDPFGESADYAPAKGENGFKKCKQKLHSQSRWKVRLSLVFRAEDGSAPNAERLTCPGDVVHPE